MHCLLSVVWVYYLLFQHEEKHRQLLSDLEQMLKEKESQIVQRAEQEVIQQKLKVKITAEQQQP